MALITEAKAAGGILEATWFATSLAKLVPSPITALGETAAGLEPILETLKAALLLAAGAQEAAALLVAVPDILMLILDQAVSVLIDILVDQINNLRNAGHALVILPITAGGYQGASRVIQAALLNTRDPNRPAFTTGATVAGWGIIAAADIATIQRLIAAIQKLFLASARLAAQAGLGPTTATLNFPDPFASQKVARRPAPQNTPPWLRVRIIDLIPGGDDLFDNLIGALKALKPPPLTLAIVDYLAFINKMIARIIAILDIVIAIIELLKALFIDIPVKIIEFDAQFGSTQDVADSVSSWFSPSQPILADVPSDLYTCGIFAVVGSEEPFSVGAQMELLRTLILPTPST